MRIIRLLVLFLPYACSGAQVIMSGSGSKPGVHFQYETRIEPELPGQKIIGFGGGGIIAGANFHRHMTDTTTKKYFGYDLAIEPEPGGMFRVTFQPLSVSAERLGLDEARGGGRGATATSGAPAAEKPRVEPAGVWSQLPLPRLPAPQIVRSRDTIAVDLFVHPGTGQRIVDYLFIQDDRQVAQPPSGPPRDYTVDDVPITLSKLRLTVNGKQVDEWGGVLTGEAVYFYLPNHGRFVFSLAPNEKLGFRADLRDYGIGAQILRDLGVAKMRLMTNNPKKVVGLHGYGLEIVERVPLEVEAHQVNEKYLKTKRDKLGHLILVERRQK